MLSVLNSPAHIFSSYPSNPLYSTILNTSTNEYSLLVQHFFIVKASCHLTRSATPLAVRSKADNLTRNSTMQYRCIREGHPHSKTNDFAHTQHFWGLTVILSKFTIYYYEVRGQSLNFSMLLIIFGTNIALASSKSSSNKIIFRNVLWELNWNRKWQRSGSY